MMAPTTHSSSCSPTSAGAGTGAHVRRYPGYPRPSRIILPRGCSMISSGVQETAALIKGIGGGIDDPHDQRSVRGQQFAPAIQSEHIGRYLYIYKAAQRQLKVHRPITDPYLKFNNKIENSRNTGNEPHQSAIRSGRPNL